MFFRFCFFLIILAFAVAPYRSFAQNRPVSRETVQARQTSPAYPTQRRGILEHTNAVGSQQVENPGADGLLAGALKTVPAQGTNADVSNKSTVVTPQRREAISTSDSQSAVRRPKTQGKNGVATNSPKTTTSNDDESANKFLEQTDGKYTFLKLAKDEKDFKSTKLAPNAQIVVIPRKNFRKTDAFSEDVVKSSDKSALELEPGASKDPSLLVSEGQNEKEKVKTANKEVDDYVGFVLTGLDYDERILLKDARDGEWNSTDLLSAALIAEGLTTAQQRARCRAVYGRLLATLKPRVERIREPFQKSEIVYRFLHETALTSNYDLNSSSVAKALNTGAFNCVSATVLFNCFAKSAGLNVVALETKGHAKSRIKFEDSFLDVETTCSDWSRLPDHIRSYSQNGKSLNDSDSIAEGGVPAQLNSKPIIRGNVEDSAAKIQNSNADVASMVNDVKAQSDAVKSTQTSEAGSTSFEVDSDAPLGYSFTKIKRPMHEISEVELVATIYYNVGVDYCQAGAYEQAVASYIKAIQLAPNNHTIIGNLKATLNNWAINLAAKEKRYDAAIQITLFGLALDPNFDEFRVNLPIFFNDWIEYLAKDNKWEEIKSVQEESKRILATIPE